MPDPQLTLMRLKPLAQDGLVFKPFSAEADFTEGWWGDAHDGEPLHGYSTPEEVEEQWFVIFDGQNEIARAEVEVRDQLDETYPAPSVPGPYAVINFFEVSADHRRRGYGRRAIELLATRFEGRPFVAFSEADEFWAALGWERHEHKTDSASQSRFVGSVKAA